MTKQSVAFDTLMVDPVIYRRGEIDQGRIIQPGRAPVIGQVEQMYPIPVTQLPANTAPVVTGTE